MFSSKNVRFVRGQRGKLKLVVDGYSYIKNKVYQKKAYWNCAHVKLQKCRARIITGEEVGSDIRITNNHHNHPREFSSCAVKTEIE